MRSEQGPEKRPVLEIGEGDSKENRKKKCEGKKRRFNLKNNGKKLPRPDNQETCSWRGKLRVWSR